MNANAYAIVANFSQSILNSYIFFNAKFKTKKREKNFCFSFFYGRFLIISRASTIATTMIKTNSPAIAGMKYMSAVDVSG